MLADERPINVRPWLYRISRNRCLNHLRRPVPEGQDSMDVMVGEGGVTTAERVQKREDFRALVEKYDENGPLGGQFTRERFPGAHLRHPPFVWDDVAYQPGTLLAVGMKGTVTVRHQIRTAGTAKGIILKPDKESLVADGDDVVFIEANVVDSAGTVVPTAQNWISFSATGPGRLLGGTTEIDAISGAVAINLQSTGEAGKIAVRATAPDLAPASILLPAKT